MPRKNADDDDDLLGEPRTRSSALYKLLLKKLPSYRVENDNKKLNAKRLAADLEISPQAFYKWVWADRIPPKQVTKLVALEGTLTQEDVLPFVL